MVFEKITLYTTLFLLLIGLVNAASTTANVINTPPTLTVTSMNLNPGTSRDIYSFITDPNGNEVKCSYCVDNNCYQTCRIYAPKIPGIYRINITLNDSIDAVVQKLTVFVPGEVPQKSTSLSSSDVPALPEENPSSPYNDSTVLKNEANNQTESSRDEEPGSENNAQTNEYCTPEVVKEKALTGKDIIFSIIILGLLGVILGLLEKDHKKKIKQRHEKITTLGEIFTEEKDE